jgi:predicted small lipoprotein YifL
MITLQKKQSTIRTPLLFLLILLTGSLTACGGKAPQISIEPALQNLGTQPQQLIDLVYTVKNNGNADLVIEKVSVSCECTTAELEKNTIPPGESAELRVKFDPAEDNLFGDIQRIIYLRSNDPEKPEAEAEFRVIIQKPEG